MLCYSCAEQGVHQPAVALCRSCSAGLCTDHLRDTAARFASDVMLSHCHHDTWNVTEHHPRASAYPLRRSPTLSRTEAQALDSQLDASTHTIRRLLFVADDAVVDVNELPSRVRAVIDEAAEVYVLTPTLPGRLAWMTDDVDQCRHVADERLDTVLGHLRSIGARASGDALRGSVLTVFADAVHEFQPDHILVGLRSSEHANWQERGLIEHVKERFGLPVMAFAIDSEEHISTAPDPASVSLR